MSLKTMDSKIKKKWMVGISVIILPLLLLGVWLLGGKKNVLSGTPTLAIETPQRVSITDTKEITLDMTISSLGSAAYPAASMSISFDPSRLEFIGIKEGNVFIRSGENGVSQKLPEWSCNPEQCNKTGEINIMYLDITSGKNTFSKYDRWNVYSLVYEELLKIIEKKDESLLFNFPD